MKYITILLILFTSCKDKLADNEYHMTIYSGFTIIPIDDYYRKIIGYDSIQLIIRHGKLEANFCYPNTSLDTNVHWLGTVTAKKTVMAKKNTAQMVYYLPMGEYDTKGTPEEGIDFSKIDSTWIINDSTKRFYFHDSLYCDIIYPVSLKKKK